MQFHLNGYRSGDPSVAEAVAGGAGAGAVDVLVVGCGPAGLTLAAQLAAFPDISTMIAERKPGPLERGQADGIACRTMEMFEAFGFAEKVAKEAYWVNETTFWRPGPKGRGLARADRVQDVEDGLSEFPHTVLNQARVHDFYLEAMAKAPRRLAPDYNRELIDLRIERNARYPVVAVFRRLDRGGARETVCARYAVGCDGARSTVRESLGHKLKGEAARQLWGVMDVLAVTDFPDIRLKCALQSAELGSVLVIPREGGYLVRMYIELDELRADERAADRRVTPASLIEKARAILDPYRLDVKEMPWWSAYEIGQRVCDAFDDVPEGDRAGRNPQVFIAGDACHTHSPKAGQGMNVSMADAFNLGWKLAAVLRGQAAPALLHSYSDERRAKAKELIDFDRDMARLFSTRPENAAAAEFQRYFTKHARYTAGVETRYDPSIVTGSDRHQALARGLTVGMRFHSAPVIRVADAKPMHLGHVLEADGRWRLIVFAAARDEGQPDGGVAGLCDHLLGDPAGPLRRHTPDGADIDSVIDVRVVFQTGHRALALEAMPSLLLPSKGRYGLTDYEKIFCADPKDGCDIFDLREIDRARGAVVVVRPDQFVAGVLPLSDRRSLAAFFAGFMMPAASSVGPTVRASASGDS